MKESANKCQFGKEVQRNQFVIKGQGADLICFIDVFDKKGSSTLILDATIVRQIDCLEKNQAQHKRQSFQC